MEGVDGFEPVGFEIGGYRRSLSVEFVIFLFFSHFLFFFFGGDFSDFLSLLILF